MKVWPDMRTCPRCSLANPDSAVRCDCGFNFNASRSEVTKVLDTDRAAAKKRAVGGLVIGGTAIAVSTLSLVSARHGGNYVVFYGAAVSGLAIAARSYARLRRLSRAQKDLDVKKEGSR